MFENPRRGRQARNFTTNVPKILDLKSSSEQIFSRKLSLGAPAASHPVELAWLEFILFFWRYEMNGALSFLVQFQITCDRVRLFHENISFTWHLSILFKFSFPARDLHIYIFLVQCSCPLALSI